MIKVPDSPVVCNNGYARRKTVHITGDSTAQFLDRSLTRPSFATTGAGGGGAAFAVFSTVVDTVFRRCSTHSAKLCRRPGTPQCSPWCGPSFCPSIPTCWPQRLWPHSSLTTVAWSPLVLLVDTSRFVPFGCRQAHMLGTMVGMDQKDRYAVMVFFWTSFACAETSGRRPR